MWVKTYAPFQPCLGLEPDAPINRAHFATFQSPTPFDRFTITASNPELGLLDSVAYTNVAVAAVPEPATLALVGGGRLALGAGARRRRMQ